MPKPNHHDKILSAGLAVFHETGFHGSGIQDIVDCAGVPKGSFYNHFKSKDALALEILEHYWELGGEARKELSASKYPVMTRIDRYLKAIVYDEKGCLIGNFSSELANSETFRPLLSKQFKEWRSELATCIKEGQEDGSIQNNESAANLAEFIITSLQGAIMKSRVDHDPKVRNRHRKSVQLHLQKH